MAARQSPSDSTNNPSVGSPNQNQLHSSSASAYYHHYHSTALPASNQAANSSANYSPPHNNINQNASVNGNESPNSVDQFTNTSGNNIQLPETPNSLVTMMGPTSGNSDSNDATNNNLHPNSSTETASTAIANNGAGYPWCASASTHQFSLINTPTIPSSSYNTPTHHPSASIYSAHHNLSSLIPHQNFAHAAHSGKSYGMSQSFYPTWYWSISTKV